MAGFGTVDSVINALSVLGQGQYLPFNKTLPSTTVAAVPHTLWAATGLPAAGANTTAGLANGRLLTSATTGALPFNNAVTNTSSSIIAVEATPFAAAGVGSLYLVDRICDCNVAINTATGAFTGMDATSRLAANEGGQIWLEVTTALSAASNTITLTYTNQAGVGSKVTGNIVTVASAIVGRSPTGNLWVPLANGDSGVRSIQTWTLSAGTATGNINVCIVRPICRIPLPTAGVVMARDFVCELPNLKKIYDNSCLTWIFIPNAAGTPQWDGIVTIACN